MAWYDSGKVSSNTRAMELKHAAMTTGKLPGGLTAADVAREFKDRPDLADVVLGALRKGQGVRGGTGVVGAPTSPGVFAPGMGGGAPGGVGGGGQVGNGTNSIYQQMLNDSAAKQQAAQAANEQRYQDILNAYQGRTTRAMAGLENMGALDRQDLTRAYQGLSTANQQNLINSGLSGSTVATTQRAGDERERQNALDRLNQRISDQKTATTADLEKDRLAFMERRTDEYPDMNLLAQLGQGLGASGYGNAVYTPPTSATIQPAPAQPIRQVAKKPSAVLAGKRPVARSMGQAYAQQNTGDVYHDPSQLSGGAGRRWITQGMNDYGEAKKRGLTGDMDYKAWAQQVPDANAYSTWKKKNWR